MHLPGGKLTWHPQVPSVRQQGSSYPGMQRVSMFWQVMTSHVGGGPLSVDEHAP